ncbi:class I SAM-dependent methyltransferase [Elusimicrobiota bacterium]
MKNIIKLITRKMRADIALRYIEPRETHLDIGCGVEKYLLKRSPCREKIGYDELLGDHISKKIPIDRADYITMLAVIEHLEYPEEIIKECHRILTDEGLMIITTPKENAETIIRLYTGKSKKEMDETHKQYFNKQNMEDLLIGVFTIEEYRLFEFGLNQLFVCKKVPKTRRK